ncbi:MAG TPA: SDR family oxidoreductase [Gammaproteobacteria bacterium]
MANILVTGASRGLGLEWVRQCAERGWRVFATCREPFEAGLLQRLVNDCTTVSMHPLDVADPASVAALPQALGEVAIDVLVHNAGVWLDRDPGIHLGNLDFTNWETTWRVNVMGPARVTQALLPHVQRRSLRLVVGIGSDMGSIARATSPVSYAYRAGEAGLNALMHCMAFELQRLGIGVLILHPGWVRTAMGGSSATLSVEQSVAGMLQRVDAYRPEQSGRFFTWDGRELPW